jgi:hypothetical protein
MIRQAINCDICAAEKQTSNYWFVAYETGGELKLRGWESPQNSRKGAKHLCGQKCAQRMMEGLDLVAKGEEVEVINRAERSERTEKTERTDRLDRTDRSLVGRANVASADLDAESWAGPVRVKEESWEAPAKRQPERENFLHAPRVKPSALNRLQRMV